VSCALCKRNKPLLNSHIIPEFLYQELYDGLHRFHRISTAPEARNRLLQKGLREPLLCGDCEQHFSVWERYASHVLFGGMSLSGTREESKIRIVNLDYAKFKLFQLSILWRAGVSSRPEFRQIRLGPHQERLRAMLLASNPGLPQDYPCLMFIVLNEGRPIGDLIVEPSWSRLDGHKCYRFVFGGMAWIQAASGHCLARVILDSCLKQDGSCVIRLQDWREMKFLVDTTQKLAASGKLD